jgi:hypothetical protein
LAGREAAAGPASAAPREEAPVRILVVERLVWDVPDDLDLSEVARQYQQTYAQKIDEPLRMAGGAVWTLVRVDDVGVLPLPKDGKRPAPA